MMDDTGSAEEWSGLAQVMASHFEKDFCDKVSYRIYDHLNTDGTPDLQFRPNQLYCFELIGDSDFKQRVTRRVWEELVYPWGVASLAQWDPQFHPQHENWHYYHKDDAYHNGTIWLWNNGEAMQRMIEYGQKEEAWKLFKNMNRQALHEGAVGSLSENADAHPREGQNWVNRSGTFLQAWSNAEHLRVWYQYFLGIRPDMLEGQIVIDPQLPAEVTSLETSVNIGGGTLHYRYSDGKVDIRLEGIDAEVVILDGASEDIDPSIFEGVQFCQPDPLESYPCFATYHETALTY
jgi:glycogen debranching enzyme